MVLGDMCTNRDVRDGPWALIFLLDFSEDPEAVQVCIRSDKPHPLRLQNENIYATRSLKRYHTSFHPQIRLPGPLHGACILRAVHHNTYLCDPLSSRATFVTNRDVTLGCRPRHSQRRTEGDRNPPSPMRASAGTMGLFLVLYAVARASEHPPAAEEETCEVGQARSLSIRKIRPSDVLSAREYAVVCRP
eukprot:1348453-Amorphochlora_amoeboformis.AAC.2